MNDSDNESESEEEDDFGFEADEHSWMPFEENSTRGPEPNLFNPDVNEVCSTV